MLQKYGNPIIDVWNRVMECPYAHIHVIVYMDKRPNLGGVMLKTK